MRKIKPVLIATLLLSGALVGCGNDNQEPPVTDTKPDGGTEKPPVDNPPAPKEDFTVKTTCEAGSFEKELYKFSAMDPKNPVEGDFNDPKLYINVDTNDWSYVTSIYEDKVKLLSENEEVIPSSAISYKKIDNIGNGGSNVIVGFELSLALQQLKLGTTKIKASFTPSNGSTSASPLELCVPLEVVDYGSIQVPMVKLDFDLDLTKLPSDFDNQDLEFRVYDNSYEYGSAYSRMRSFPFTKNNLTLNDIDIPLGHGVGFDIFAPNATKFLAKSLTLESNSSISMEKGYYVFNTEIPNAIRAFIE